MKSNRRNTIRFVSAKCIIALIACVIILAGAHLPAQTVVENGFVKHELLESILAQQSLQAVDLNDDGLLDILPGSRANPGFGKWIEQTASNETPYVEHTLPLSQVGYAVAGDMDRNGIPDIVLTSFNGVVDTLYWLPNSSTSPGEFSHPVKIQENHSQYSLPTLSDVDADGDMDVLCLNYWYENDGASNPAFTEHNLRGSDQSHLHWVFDADGDEDLDIFALDFESYAVHLSDGSRPPEFLLGEVLGRWGGWFESGISAYPCDVDDDGDIDMFATDPNSGRMEWLENDGSAHFIVHQFADWAATSLWVDDIDADGDQDIIYVSSRYTNDDGDVGVGWFEMTANAPDQYPSFTLTHHTIDTGDYDMLTVADMDNDGDLDILTGAVPSGIYLYENRLSEQPDFGKAAQLDLNNDKCIDGKDLLLFMKYWHLEWE